jgi:4-amino-4-deoxy-L-arabinose transferase-like glycosyltransferase
MSLRRGLPAVAASTITLLLGQAVLVALGPLSRAQGTFTESAGLAIIAPDSSVYLGATSLSDVFTLPWTRWGYPLLLAIGRGLIEPAAFAVIVNAFALLSAGYVLYRTVEDHARRFAALSAVGILHLNPMTAQWLRIAMTESVFFATVVIISALTHRYLTDSINRSGLAMLLVTAAFAAITRPNGFLVATSVLFLMATKRPGRLQRRILATGTLLLAATLLPLANNATGPPAEGSLTSQLYAGVVIEGTEHVRSSLPMPPPADEDDDSYRAALRYVMTHPLATARLGLSRVVMETIQVRRHYPAVVNIGFGAAMLMLFLSVAAGWRDPRAGPSPLICLTIAIPLMTLTAVTFAVPEGRYAWAYLLPSVPIAGVGAARALEWASPRTYARIAGAS